VATSLVRRTTGPRSGRIAGGAAVATLVIAGLAGCGKSHQINPTTTLQAGIKLQNAGQLDAARQLYQEVLAKQADNYYALFDLGSIYQKEGQTVAALNQYGKALIVNPRFIPALYNQAVIYASSDPVLAISIYRNIISIDPTQASSQFNLGLLEISRREVAQGITDIATATKADRSLFRRVPKGNRAAVRTAQQHLGKPASPPATPSATAKPQTTPSATAKPQTSTTP
jgi:tetratricopeptide (TPR) repeat protein